MQIRFYEYYARKLKTLRCLGGKLQRSARKIGSDHHSPSPRQIQTHLSSTASQIQDMRVAWNCLIEQARKFTPFGASTKPGKTRAGRVAGERCLFIEGTHRLSTGIAPRAQIGNSVWRLVLLQASAARQVRREIPPACGTGKQLQKFLHRLPDRIDEWSQCLYGHS